MTKRTRETRSVPCARGGIIAAAALALLATGCVVIVDEAGEIVDVRPGLVVTAPPPTAPPAVASMVVVPSVVGHAYRSAEAILADTELSISGVNYRHSSEPAGTVVAQSPHAGAIARSGSGIALTLAISRPQARVPDVVGKTLVGATLTLHVSGLRRGGVRYVNVPGVGSPRVGSQSLHPGSSAAPGTRVDLVIHNPSPKVIIPNVVGRTYLDASRDIRNAGLRVKGLSRANHPTIARGSVVSQSPPAGTMVDPNTSVSLQLSSGAGSVSVPSVVGRTAASAIAELARAGLRSHATYQAMTGLPGRVRSQTPAPGSRVARGSVVNLIVSKSLPHVVRIAVPDLTGRRRGEANAILTAARLRSGTVSYGAGRPGRVVSQTPAAGTLVTSGTAVSYVIGRLGIKPPTLTVSVPGVVGLTQSSAEAAVRRAGLTPNVTKAVGPRPGRVTSQSPSAGRTVARGSVVRLVVSGAVSPAARVAVPSLKGRTPASANVTLSLAGLKVGTVSYGAGTPGRVVSQSPAAGTLVKRGTAVSYVVGRFGVTPPTTTVPVPDLKGRTPASANAALTAAGLRAGTVSYGPGRPGRVVSQSPAARTPVRRGTAVSYVVGRTVGGPPTPPTPTTVTVPNVVGLTQSSAQAALRRAGLVVGRVTQGVGPRRGRVLSQSPSAGRTVARGTSVSLTVAGTRLLPPGGVGVPPPKPPTPTPPKPPTPTKPTPPALASVPSVIGMSLPLARIRLRQAGLAAGAVTTRKVPGGKKGRVVGQSPAAGSRVARGSQVALVVSR